MKKLTIKYLKLPLIIGISSFIIGFIINLKFLFGLSSNLFYLLGLSKSLLLIFYTPFFISSIAFIVTFTINYTMVKYRDKKIEEEELK